MILERTEHDSNELAPKGYARQFLDFSVPLYIFFHLFPTNRIDLKTNWEDIVALCLSHI